MEKVEESHALDGRHTQHCAEMNTKNAMISNVYSELFVNKWQMAMITLIAILHSFFSSGLITKLSIPNEFKRKRFYFKTSRAVAFYPSVWWVTLGWPSKSLMFSVTIICIKQPVPDASKTFVEAAICPGEEKLSQKKLHTPAWGHFCEETGLTRPHWY